MNKKKLISAYSYGLFIFLMLFAFATALVPFLLSHLWSKKPRVYFQKIVQQYFRLFYKLMPLLGKVTVINRDIANRYHPCIYVSTHQSSMDYTLLSTIIDDYTTTSNHPISDFFLFMKFPRNGLGIYYIPKGQLDLANKGYQNLKKALKLNSSVILFPEGTRNPTNHLKKFKGGAFRLAIEEGVPVVPIIIDGTGSIVTKGSNVTRTLEKKDVTITFLDPIYPNRDEKFMEFGKRVRQIMQDYIEKKLMRV